MSLKKLKILKLNLTVYCWILSCEILTDYVINNTLTKNKKILELTIKDSLILDYIEI
jgi:hypothetical protein